MYNFVMRTRALYIEGLSTSKSLVWQITIWSASNLLMTKMLPELVKTCASSCLEWCLSCLQSWACWVAVWCFDIHHHLPRCHSPPMQSRTPSSWNASDRLHCLDVLAAAAAAVLFVYVSAFCWVSPRHVGGGVDKLGLCHLLGFDRPDLLEKRFWGEQVRSLLTGSGAAVAGSQLLLLLTLFLFCCRFFRFLVLELLALTKLWSLTLLLPQLPQLLLVSLLSCCLAVELLGSFKSEMGILPISTLSVIGSWIGGVLSVLASDFSLALLEELTNGGLPESGVEAGVVALIFGLAFSSPHELSALVPG